jgi:nucleoredoxin
MSCSNSRMRHLLLTVLVAGAALSDVLGRSLPLTTKEVTLMLRAGFSSEGVQRELSIRCFADPYDAAAEKALREAGAAAALVDALKSGSYASSPADARAAQDELNARTTRRAREKEQSRKFNTIYQDQLARARLAAPPRAETSNVLASQFKGDLVSWKNGSLVSFDDEPLAKKKLIALYFSAHWCGPCRKFTPQLVEFYNRVAPEHPEFEIVFVSNDRSPIAMETYMRDAQMPWPAIAFAKLPGKEALNKYAGEGIPCLVLLDANGSVLSDSYSGKQRVGPAKVLTDLTAVLAKGSAAEIAVSR